MTSVYAVLEYSSNPHLSMIEPFSLRMLYRWLTLISVISMYQHLELGFDFVCIETCLLILSQLLQQYLQIKAVINAATISTAVTTPNTTFPRVFTKNRIQDCFNHKYMVWPINWHEFFKSAFALCSVPKGVSLFFWFYSLFVWLACNINCIYM